MEDTDNAGIPVLRFRWLTRFYAPLLLAVLNGHQFRVRLIEQVRLAPGATVLDLGCGTATLTIMLKRAYPDARVVGFDRDAAVLAIARDRATAAGVAIELRQGLASAPPFGLGSCDCIVSSLLFHRLTSGDKRRTLATAHALLRPGGELHVADWGQAQNARMRLAFLGVQLLEGFQTTTVNVRGCLPRFMEEAGFAAVTETHRDLTTFGTLSLYRAVKP